MTSRHDASRRAHLTARSGRQLQSLRHGARDHSSLFDLAASLTRRSPPGQGSSGDSGSSSTAAATTTTSAASSSCAPNDNSARCQRPTDASSNSATLPIALGVVIPIVIAFVVFIFLHRRHVRRLRAEDANDKHASLDYGMERPAGQAGKGNRGNKKYPEMTVNPLDPLGPGGQRGRGLSVDIGAMGSPYVLPPGLHGSRESLHSLTRSMVGADDRYRPATNFIPNDGSRPSYANSFARTNDNASNYTGSSAGLQDHMDQELLKNASRMSRSSPPSRALTPALNTEKPMPPPPGGQSPPPNNPILRKGLPPTPRPGGLSPPKADDDVVRDSYVDRDAGELRRSNNYLGALINQAESTVPSPQPSSEVPARSNASAPSTSPPARSQANESAAAPPAIDVQPPSAHPPRKASKEANNLMTMPQAGEYFNGADEYDPQSIYDEHDKGLPPAPQRQSLDLSLPAADKPNMTDEESLAPSYDMRRLSMGVRPLPPEDPSDDPEQRANRIRSFYKEYFDDSKPGPSRGEYYEDYGADYLGDAAYYDPDEGNFVLGAGAPFAEPITRRAMTPPPRAPPRFRGPPRSHGSSMSGLVPPPGPRAYSSASGRFGPMGPGARGPPGPRKPMPPPAPLRVLPTPHMLREDAFALPIEFAPPSSYRDRREGRPESPRGGLMPYVPRPTHNPLASSYDDLSAMPSPHALRKSGTFTALDFAPPPRFKSNETASDSGSIRSNRSGMSAAQIHNIRAGAYRISRIPKEVVGTKNDLAAALRPTWDMKT